MADKHPDIAALLRWDTGSVIADEAYGSLRANPRYAEAVRAFASNMLAASDADPFLDGILKDAGRTLAAMCSIYLHLSGGLTLPRLKALCVSFGVISPGRARTLLIYLRYLQYVEPLPATRGSARLYAPKPAFLAAWSGLIRAVLGAMQVLEPGVRVLLSQFDKPGVFETSARYVCEQLLAAANQANLEAPAFRIFMHRYAGRQILQYLLSASGDDVFPPRGPIPISLTGMAERFGVSRIHVRRLLNAAQKEGLITRLNENTVVFEEPGRAALDRIFSIQIAHLLMAAACTLKARPDLLETAGETGHISSKAAGR